MLPSWWEYKRPFAIRDCISGMMTDIPPNSVDIVVTSPPYNVGMEYEEDLTESEYYTFLDDVFLGIKRVLKPDGRICWNVPYQMYTKTMGREFSQWFFSVKALRSAGLKLRDNITWNQNNSDNDTAWGSFCSASSPWIRHQTEAIIIAYNERWKKDTRGKNTITKDEFMEYVLDIWHMNTDNQSEHPASYPLELPLRCLKLFSYQGDVVLDPFLGSGTTLKATRILDRVGIGFEKDARYEQKIINKSLCDDMDIRDNYGRESYRVTRADRKVE